MSNIQVLLPLESGIRVKDVPASRWNTDEFYAPEKTPGKSYIKWGGFLDSIEDFDPAYFKIPEALAIQTDIQ